MISVHFKWAVNILNVTGPQPHTQTTFCHLCVDYRIKTVKKSPLRFPARPILSPLLVPMHSLSLCKKVSPRTLRGSCSSGFPH